jgi:superoxide dismutase, Fe-Mn family
MPFELKPLPYLLTELEPSISARTLEFHHGKHLQTYVNNLNNLINGTKFENSSLDAIVMEGEAGTYNNAAQVWNHNFYFTALSAHPILEPGDKMSKAINSSFGSFSEFKDKFSKQAITLFGSGWTWLVKTASNTLEIIQEPNAGNPMKRGQTPLFTCDVWEHAYYLDYQNRRPDYILAFWKLLDWKVIEDRY